MQIERTDENKVIVRVLQMGKTKKGKVGLVTFDSINVFESTGQEVFVVVEKALKAASK